MKNFIEELYYGNMKRRTADSRMTRAIPCICGKRFVKDNFIP